MTYIYIQIVFMGAVDKIRKRKETNENIEIFICQYA